MFNKLIQRLTSPSPQNPLPNADARFAIAALLVRIARSDEHYTGVEAKKIEQILSIRYRLSTQESTKLRKKAEKLEQEAPDTVQFTRTIKHAIAYEDRLSVIEAFWAVALADNERDDTEDSLLRLTSKLLGISDVDSARARQRVQSEHQSVQNFSISDRQSQ
ncbi:MAG: TerB family tellurite resistance protein [Aestuariivita sp.]|nr:TerB family tellurite resistance protein [Aestuariivita sp.]